MAEEPRRVSTRRAVLSYDQLARLTKESGFRWPDLLIKDYQGIIQDFAFNADEIDGLEVRVKANETAIGVLEDRVNDLEARVILLEYRAYKIVPITENFTTEEFQTIICKNTSPIEVTLKPNAVANDEVRVKRRDAPVKLVGTVNGVHNYQILTKNSSPLLVFDGTDWSTI